MDFGQADKKKLNKPKLDVLLLLQLYLRFRVVHAAVPLQQQYRGQQNAPLLFGNNDCFT